MPPKKKVEEKKILLGRPGNNVTIGLVGLPNVGKSSLFNLLSGLQVAAENYPFCTIDPSTAVVPVPDKRFDFLVDAWNPKSKVPAVLSVTDIAGLVKGAAEGKGLGNAFLSHIQAVDAIYHVTRAFTDKEIEHVEGEVDPTRDFEIIRGELIAKDLSRMEHATSEINKQMRGKKNKDLENDLATANKAIDLLKNNKEVRFGDWNNKEVFYLNMLNLLTAKPAVYLVNISNKNFTTQKNKWFKAIKEWVAVNSPGTPTIPFSVPFEAELLDLADDAARAAFLKEKKLMSMIPKIITTGYHAMNLIHFFTTGEDEVRAWTVKEEWKAPQAAGVIHTDFETGFVNAQVYNYSDFEELKTEKAVAAAGKQRMQGKEYVVKDGDIMFFKSTASRGGKK